MRYVLNKTKKLAKHQAHARIIHSLGGEYVQLLNQAEYDVKKYADRGG